MALGHGGGVRAEDSERESEMEGTKNMRRAAVMALVVMLVFAGQVSARFKKCYGVCLFRCMVKTRKPLTCAVECFKECLIRSDSTPNPHYYCQLGCSINECAVKYSHDAEQMESCLDNCSSHVCLQG